MSEWFKEHAWKACVGETLPRVRIPLSPPPSLADARLVSARAVFLFEATCFARRQRHRIRLAPLGLKRESLAHSTTIPLEDFNSAGGGSLSPEFSTFQRDRIVSPA